MKKVLGLTILIPFICSCASMFAIGHNDFKCKATEKEGMCAPVDKVYETFKNENVENGKGKVYEVVGKKLKCRQEVWVDEEVTVCREIVIKREKIFTYPLKEAGGKVKIPVRRTERIQRVWIYPYVDKSGNFIDGHFIYVVVEEGKWLDSKGREVD